MYSVEAAERWFYDFVAGFAVNGEFSEYVKMKRAHSLRVRHYCVEIAKSLEWNEEHDEWLANVIGLLHDVGRFEQQTKYKTFADAKSFDHGDRGAEILSSDFDWAGISEGDKNKVLCAVRNHNKIEIPKETPLAVYRFCALVRDADKIDNFGIVEQRIESGSILKLLRQSAVNLEADERSDKISPELAAQVRETGRGAAKYAKSFYDFRLIQLGWVLDLNYSVSYATVKEAGWIDKIASDLAGKGIDDLIEKMTDCRMFL